METSTPDSAEGNRKGKRQEHVTAALASMAGTTIEWYDFFLYGSAAALIFNKIFFPSFDPLTGTLAAFATYTVGFLARPLGGIVFGHFGDRVGRKSTFLFTLLLMGVPTILIGFVPSYDSIGYWAAILLTLLRVLQGLAIGGDWGGAVLIAVEHAPKGKKGFFGSLPQTGVAIGLLLSAFALALISRLPEDEMLSWGWRLPFIASTVLLIIGWYVRIRVSESPAFKKMKAAGEISHSPVKETLQKHMGATLKVMGARFGEVTWFYTVATFSLAYATQTLGLSKELILHAVMWGAAVSIVTIPFCGHIGDRIGQRWAFGIGALGVVLFSGYFFRMLRTGDSLVITLAMIVAIAVVYALLYGSEGELFPSQFPPEVRYTGISIGVQVSGAIGGGLAPLIATGLLKVGDGDPKYVTLYLVVLGVITLVSSWLMKKSDQSHR
ncbi:MAG TPA: MFS transporter [Castellaniella sp.]